MARPIQRKANKDYPNNGIKKGDTYWYVKLKLQRGGIVKRSLAPFKRSQLTTSDFLGQLYDWQDEQGKLSDMDSAQDLADTIRQLGEEQQEKFDNMPEGLQQGDTGQMIEARATACEEAASAIEEIISRWESDKEEHEEKKQAYEAWQDYERLRDEGELPEDAEEVEEVEDPGDFDEEDFIGEVQAVEVES